MFVGTSSTNKNGYSKSTKPDAWVLRPVSLSPWLPGSRIQTSEFWFIDRPLHNGRYPLLHRSMLPPNVSPAITASKVVLLSYAFLQRPCFPINSTLGESIDLDISILYSCSLENMPMHWAPWWTALISVKHEIVFVLILPYKYPLNCEPHHPSIHPSIKELMPLTPISISLRSHQELVPISDFFEGCNILKSCIKRWLPYHPASCTQ
jgi:hypothetical protein